VFGQFRVLLRQRRLLAGGVPIELGARAFDILMVLIEADGALVTKDELQSRVWPGVVVAGQFEGSDLRVAQGSRRGPRAHSDRARPGLPIHRRGSRERRRLGMRVNAPRGNATERA
jgi:hypothetical protein